MKLMSWGANTYGQLGHGMKSEQCILPLEVKDNGANPDAITSITGGGGHTLVLLKGGQVYSCGLNSKGQLGHSTDSEVWTLKEVPLLKETKICEVACGWDFSIAIASTRQLVAWGSNAFGQLGVNKNEVCYSAEPIAIPTPRIVDVAAGLRHMAVLTDSNHVLVCGNGRKGQLGIPYEENCPQSNTTRPYTVLGVHHVEKIGCGQNYTVALSAKGHLYVWGDNKHGQLALNPFQHHSVFTPMEVHPFPKETLPSGCKLFCGWTHTVLLTEDGEMFNWGRNSYGQLGTNECHRQQPWKPEKMNIGPVKQLAVGSEHNIALTDAEQVVSWGWNEHGNCGTGTVNNVTEPTLIGINAAYQGFLIGSGAGHSFAIIS